MTHEAIIEKFKALPDGAKTTAVDFMEILAAALPPSAQLEEMSKMYNPHAYAIEQIFGAAATVFAEDLDPQGHNPLFDNIRLAFYNMVRLHTGEDLRAAVSELRQQGFNMTVMVSD